MSEVSTPCVLRHRGRYPAQSYGLVCEEHAAELRDLLADVLDLWEAHQLGDRAPRPPGEGGRTKKPHAPIPLALDSWLIDNPPRRAPVDWTWGRNGNPATGRLESNGPDAPDVRAVLDSWCEFVAGEFELACNQDFTVRGCISYLRSHLSRIAASVDVDDFMWEMRACRRALAAAVGEPAGPQPIATCPYCKTPLFTDRQREVQKLRRRGEDTSHAKQPEDKVTCYPCRISWEGLELLRLKLIAEAG